VKPNRSILISGPSRTGKTTTAELLAARYGIEKVKIGEKFRELTGIDTSKFVDRPEEMDREIDRMQSQLIREATSDAPFILEARLAAFLASKERQRNPDLPIVTVLFWAPEHVRMERQLRKVRRDDPNTRLTLEDLRDKEREREAGDLKLWRAVHPDLDNKNVFDPALTDDRGKPVYDFVVDTRLGMPDTCADAVHRYLLRIGAFGG
jgi:cytidylate kinase